MGISTSERTCHVAQVSTLLVYRLGNLSLQAGCRCADAAIHIDKSSQKVIMKAIQDLLIL